MRLKSRRTSPEKNPEKRRISLPNYFLIPKMLICPNNRHFATIPTWQTTPDQDESPARRIGSVSHAKSVNCRASCLVIPSILLVSMSIVSSSIARQSVKMGFGTGFTSVIDFHHSCAGNQVTNTCLLRRDNDKNNSEDVESW